MIPDLINGLFELIGGFFIWNNVRLLIKQKDIKGVSILTTGVFAAWGFWNLFYYPSLNQWLSFLGGINVAAANVIWIWLAIRYTRGNR